MRNGVVLAEQGVRRSDHPTARGSSPPLPLSAAEQGPADPRAAAQAGRHEEGGQSQSGDGAPACAACAAQRCAETFCALNPCAPVSSALLLHIHKPSSHSPAPPSLLCSPPGLYLWGSVGSGKSLIMDLFYDAVASTLPLQHHRRMHFNAAMLEVRAWPCSQLLLPPVAPRASCRAT